MSTSHLRHRAGLPRKVFNAFFVVLVLVVIIVIVCLELQVRREKTAGISKRIREYSLVAEEINFSFHFDMGELANIGPLGEMYLFSEHSQYDHYNMGRYVNSFQYVFHGHRSDAPVYMFEYSLEVRSGGKYAEYTRYTTMIAAFQLPGKQIPYFYLRPSMGGMNFLKRDIDFLEHPQFSKTYVLAGANEKATRQLFFNDALINYFEFNSQWSVEGNKDWLIVYRWDKTVEPSRIPQFLEEASRIAKLFR